MEVTVGQDGGAVVRLEKATRVVLKIWGCEYVIEARPPGLPSAEQERTGFLVTKYPKNTPRPVQVEPVAFNAVVVK